MDNQNIQYKINKYTTKYFLSNESYFKLIYAKKYLQYIQLEKQNLIQTGGTNTNTNTDELINTINQEIEKINDTIVKVKPTYDLVNNFDKEVRKKITQSYAGYNKEEDLFTYYNEVTDEIKEILE